MKKKIIESFVTEKSLTKKSLISGEGVFAKTKLFKGEIVFIKGGRVLTRQTMLSFSKIDSYWPLDEDFVLAAKYKEEIDKVKLKINHSCEPNCGIRGDIVGVAIEDIKSGKELTFDYAFLDNENYRFKCTCGSPTCRKIITGFDWQIKSIQDKYFSYFVTYLKEKITDGFYYEVTSILNEQICFFRKKVFCDELGFKEENEFDGTEENYIHCCLYKQQKLIAYARVQFLNGIANIGRVLVEQSERKKGYGKQIVFWAETESLKKGYTKIEIHALEDKKSFYEKLGYSCEGNVILEEGKKHHLMKKEINLD